MEPITLQDGTQLDPKVVKVMRTIRTLESGGEKDPYNSTRTEPDGRVSKGAYQWLNDNFETGAKKHGLNPSDFSKANQNKLAYAQIKAYKDAGRTPEEIDALWNGAHKNKETGLYTHNNSDRAIKFRNTLTGNTEQGTINNSSSEDSNSNIKKETQQGNQDLINLDTQPKKEKESPVILNQKIDKKLGLVGDIVKAVTPGKKIAQGLGYSINNLFGGQKGIIKAQNQGLDIQTELLKRIKENKAQGKDTSRLEKALQMQSQNIEKTGSQVSDVGTGGIKNGQVWASAASLAALPAMAYASTVAGGGGLLGTSRGLTAGKLGKAGAPVSTELKALINASDKLGFSDKLNKGLNAKDYINLSNHEKFLRLNKLDQADILGYFYKQYPQLLPAVKASGGGLASLIKGGLMFAGGNYVKNKVNEFTGKAFPKLD